MNVAKNGKRELDYDTSLIPSVCGQIVVPPELANVGFSEKLVYLPDTYQANDYNLTYAFCGGETLEQCQASIRYEN